MTKAVATTPQRSLDVLRIKPTLPVSIRKRGAEEYVKALTREFAEALNTKDCSSPIWDHLTTDVHSSHDAGNESISTSSQEELIEKMRRVMDSFPDYHTEVLDVSAEVNETTGSAKAWMLRTCNGFPDGLRRETVCQLTWERRNGDWYCSSYRGIRSFPWWT